MRSTPLSISALSLCMLLVCGGCSGHARKVEQGQERLRESQAREEEIRREITTLTETLGVLNQKATERQKKKNEFSAKAAQSGSKAKLLAKYRAELEASLQLYETAIGNYRKKHLTP